MDINLSKYLQKDYSCAQLIPIALDAAAQVHNAAVSGAEKTKKVQEALSEFIKALPVEDDKKKELQAFVHDVLPHALDAAIRVTKGQFKPSRECVMRLCAKISAKESKPTTA